MKKEKEITIHNICQWCFDKLEPEESEEILCKSHRQEFALEPISRATRLAEGYDINPDLRYPLMVTPTVRKKKCENASDSE